MVAQETIRKAESVCSLVDSFKRVVRGSSVNIDYGIFNFTYYSTRGNRSAQTDKEYSFNGWTLFAVIESDASVMDGDVTIYSNCICSLDLYDDNGQEQPLTTGQQRTLEQAILKTIIL